MNCRKQGVLDQTEFVTTVQSIAIAHREAGDPNNLADAIHAISEHFKTLLTSGDLDFRSG
jgi:hypothetical protein